MTYGLELDLSGCDWWHGGAIQMSASLDHVDGLNDEGVNTLVICEAFAAIAEPGAEAEEERDAAVGPRDCAVQVELDHLPVEADHYHGEIEYPGPDGTAVVSFDAVCVAAAVQARCSDLEASPAES